MSLGLLLAATAVLDLVGCGQTGKVNQGRVVAYDVERGLATIISDSNPTDPKEPRYDALPPVEVKIPADPRQMGPAPRAGRLVSLDTDRMELTVFEKSSRTLRAIPCRLVERRANLRGNERRAAELLIPVVDRGSKTITIYSSQTQELIRLSVPDVYLDLPEDTWRFGDEVRYYFKDPAQALRMMNVTRTRIF